EEEQIQRLARTLGDQERATKINAILRGESRWQISTSVSSQWKQVGAEVTYNASLGQLLASMWQPQTAPKQPALVELLASVVLVNLFLIARHEAGSSGPYADNVSPMLLRATQNKELVDALVDVWGTQGLEVSVDGGSGTFAPVANVGKKAAID